MSLTVHESNHPARLLYEGLGWQPTGLTETTPIDAELLVEYERLL
jgi:ribosomal protein S18 acetylase RimI-like enzyme